MSSGQEVGDIFAYGHGPATALLRSPTVIIASIALWGMNIQLFRRFGIDHVRVITGSLTDHNSNNEEKEQLVDGESLNDSDDLVSSSGGMTSIKCFFLSALLYILLNLTTYIWMDVLDGTTIGAILFFYAVTFIGIVFPCESTQWIRNAAKTVFYRGMELFNPRCACVTGDAIVPIPFIDVFFADGMCSLSKVFFDLGMLWHLASHYPNNVPHSVHSIVIPSVFAALPYMIRARQCIVMLNYGKAKNDPKRYHHGLNAIKYSTSLFPICVSAYQKTVDESEAEKIEFYLILLLIINSLYAYAWDIIMDWGMMQNPTAAMSQTCLPNMAGNEQIRKQECTTLFLRPRLRFGGLISTSILFADGIFRFGWVLRFFQTDLFSSVDSYILFTELLEVSRRALWNLLRVEWENMKQVTAKKDEKSSSIQMVAPTANSMRATL